MTCEAGYFFSGDVICGADGLWSSMVSCTARVSCTTTQVDNSDHAAVGCISGYTGDVIRVSCDAGYAGGGDAMCGADGQWMSLTNCTALMWRLGVAGTTCTATCSSYGEKCVESFWPASLAAVQTIANGLPVSCTRFEPGSWNYNPSKVGQTCYWRGFGTSRCGGSASDDERFCPCAGAICHATMVHVEPSQYHIKTVFAPNVGSCPSPCGNECRVNTDYPSASNTFAVQVSIGDSVSKITVTHIDGGGWAMDLLLRCCLAVLPNCTDGSQNGDELGVDCGGSCPTACLCSAVELHARVDTPGMGWHIDGDSHSSILPPYSIIPHKWVHKVICLDFGWHVLRATKWGHAIFMINDQPVAISNHFGEFPTVKSLVPGGCEQDQHVANHTCVACPPGRNNDAYDNPLGPDTFCAVVRCGYNERVQNHTCVPCPPRHYKWFS